MAILPATDTTRDPTLVSTPPAGPRRFDLRRVYTAATLIPAVYVIICHLPPWALTLLLLTVGGLALTELYRITLRSPPNQWLIAVGVTVAALVVARPQLHLTLTDLLAIGALAVPTALSLSSGSLERRLKDAALVAFGVLYVGFTLSTVVSTRLLPAGEWFVLFLAVVTWAGDTGAYYTGMLWGAHPLAPSISPKKTVEGAVGGLALAVGSAVLARIWFVTDLSWSDALILGVLLTVSGLFGDLWESVIKRRVGVKDSGSLLPGHGGMLDRLDSLLFTAPTFYYYVTYVRGISPSP